MTTLEDLQLPNIIETQLSHSNDYQSFNLSIIISLLLHTFLLISFYYYNSSSSYSGDTHKVKPKTVLRTYLLKTTPLTPIVQPNVLITNPSKILATEQQNVPFTPTPIITTEIAEPIKPVILNDIILSEPITKSQLKPINYANLRTSISAVIKQENLLIQNELFYQCEQFKKRTGKIDCLSSSERNTTQMKDSYKLAKYFKRLNKYPNKQKTQRVIASLTRNKKSLNKLLQSKILPADIQESFNNEISYLRSEMIYQECKSGDCSGQVNLGKIIQLIELLTND